MLVWYRDVLNSRIRHARRADEEGPEARTLCGKTASQLQANVLQSPDWAGARACPRCQYVIKARRLDEGGQTKIDV
jgi:hypothetical protein